MVKRAKRRFLSEYGKQLREKQELLHYYHLKEYQFKRYVRKALKRRGRANAKDLLIQRLEQRLDNVIFRLGFASSRLQARQRVSHGHFLVNGGKVNISSYAVQKGDKISFKPAVLKKTFLAEIKFRLKKYEPPTWLKLDRENLEGEVLAEPSFAETAPPAELSTIFEFYSRQ